jgi:hypothetical protein
MRTCSPTSPMSHDSPAIRPTRVVRRRASRACAAVAALKSVAEQRAWLNALISHGLWPTYRLSPSTPWTVILGYDYERNRPAEHVDIVIRGVTLRRLPLLGPKRLLFPFLVDWTPRQRHRHRTLGSLCNYRKEISILAVTMLCLLTVSCGSGNKGGSDPANGHSSLAPSAATGRPSAGFVVVAGDDGVAVVKGLALRGAEGIPPQPYAEPGALAAPLVSGQAAAVVTAGHVGVVSPDIPAVVRDCPDCSGVAATSQHIVTTRKNFRLL